MLPRDLKAEQFAGYPPEARKLVVAHLDALQQLPLSFRAQPAAGGHRLRFQVSRRAHRHRQGTRQPQCSFSSADDRVVSSLRAIFSLVEAGTVRLDQPAGPVCRTAFGIPLDYPPVGCFSQGCDRLRRSFAGRRPPERIPVRRLGIAVIGQGVAAYDAPLFRNLRPHGAYFAQVKPGQWT